MPSLPSHFTSVAGLIDVVIVVVLLEAVVLGWAWRRSRRGPSPWELAFMLGAGLCLMVALRLAVTGAPIGWVAALLAASGGVHALDLRQRRRLCRRAKPAAVGRDGARE